MVPLLFTQVASVFVKVIEGPSELRMFTTAVFFQPFASLAVMVYSPEASPVKFPLL